MSFRDEFKNKPGRPKNKQGKSTGPADSPPQKKPPVPAPLDEVIRPNNPDPIPAGASEKERGKSGDPDVAPPAPVRRLHPVRPVSTEERASEQVPAPIGQMAQAQKILSGTIQRLYFGRHLLDADPSEYTDAEHGEGFLVGLGQAPSGMKGHLGVVGKDGRVGRDDGDDLYRRLADASSILQRYALPMDSGPYSDDKERTVERFTHEVFGDIPQGDLSRSVAKAISFGGFFDFDPTLVVPEDFSSAGSPLSQEGRVFQESATGISKPRMVHPLEFSRLITSCLRRKGINAYPAFGVLPAEGGAEIHVPAMAYVDLSGKLGSPLHVSSLDGSFPHMGSVDVLSDQAMMGFVHMMVAEARLKLLAKDMLDAAYNDRQIDEEEKIGRIKGVSSALFGSYSRWPDLDLGNDQEGKRIIVPGNYVINRSMESMKDVLYDALHRVQGAFIELHFHEMAAQNPMLRQLGALEDSVNRTVAHQFDGYFSILQHEYFSLIAKATARKED